MGMWRMKIPLRIKIFMWYLKHGVVLTKDNLVRRNWSGNKLCVLCSHHESIQHLFFIATLRDFCGAVQVTFNIVALD
jgi:hypothetical protein